MFKLGICTVGALRDDVAKAPRRVKQVAITLLEDLRDEPDGDRLRERVLLELSDDRGAYKRTYKDRFAEFDATVCAHAATAFPADMQLKVMDCAISDGRTAVDFFARLGVRFPDLQFLGTDYDPYLKKMTRNGVTVVFSSNNDPLQLIRRPFVFSLTSKAKDRWITNPINCLLRDRLCREYLPAMLEDLATKGAAETISLYCAEATQLAKNDPRLRLGQHDILQPLGDTYHVVRMMNVLNPTYFSVDQFEKIVANVRTGLVRGGLFVTGSNEDAGTAVKGAIFQRTESGFMELLNTGLMPSLRRIVLEQQA